MDFAIVMGIDGKTGQMTFDASENGNLMNNVWLSLSVEKGSFFQNTDFGLRRRARLKNTEATAALIVEDYKSALQWLIDTGKAVAIDVTAERDKTQDIHRLKMAVEVTPEKGDKIVFTRFEEVV